MINTFNGHIENEGLLKGTGSHVQYKSGNVLETVQDRDVFATDN